MHLLLFGQVNNFVVNPLFRPEMKVYFKQNDQYIGKVVDPFSCCDAVFNMYSANNDLRYGVKTTACQCGICCRNGCGMCSEVKFPIYNAKNNNWIPENKDGQIKKVIKNFVKEMISDADNFEIIFPTDATPEDKLLMICMTLMIDYRYFEDNGNQNNRHGHVYY